MRSAAVVMILVLAVTAFPASAAPCTPGWRSQLLSRDADMRNEGLRAAELAARGEPRVREEVLDRLLGTADDGQRWQLAWDWLRAMGPPVAELQPHLQKLRAATAASPNRLHRAAVLQGLLLTRIDPAELSLAEVELLLSELPHPRMADPTELWARLRGPEPGAVAAAERVGTALRLRLWWGLADGDEDSVWCREAMWGLGMLGSRAASAVELLERAASHDAEATVAIWRITGRLVAPNRPSRVPRNRLSRYDAAPAGLGGARAGRSAPTLRCAGANRGGLCAPENDSAQRRSGSGAAPALSTASVVGAAVSHTAAARREGSAPVGGSVRGGSDSTAAADSGWAAGGRGRSQPFRCCGWRSRTRSGRCG